MSFTARLLGALRGGVRSVGPAQAHDLAEAGALLLDVREPEEWRTGHAPHARHIPLRRLTEELDHTPQDRRIVVVCRSGSRSRTATRLLIANDRDAVNLSGGMRAWQIAGLPVVDSANRAATII